MAAAAIFNSSKYAFVDLTVTFNVRLLTFPPNLVRIGSIVKEWQPIFELKIGGGPRHLEFWLICTLNLIVAFYIIFSTFPSNLVKVGSIAKKWQPIFLIQTGGGRHLEFQ